jgi:molybdate transport system substrate-binding protein
MALHLLSGGAARGIVDALAPSFAAEAHVAIDGTFGAVGAMRQRLLDGAPCDVAILTDALIAALTAEGRLIPGSARALGRVATGIAVRAGDPSPDVCDGPALARALRAASAIYLPDPVRATAGIHFVEVLRRLGVYDAVAPALRPYPNGAAAMAALAASEDPRAIGCTQVTEIRHAAGVSLVGVLPTGLELVTVYTAAVCRDAADPDHAAMLIEWLSGPRSLALRSAGGFES